MLEVVSFTAVAIALYVVSDKIVNVVETRRGARLANRSIVFFAIILSLALISFTILEHVLGG